MAKVQKSPNYKQMADELARLVEWFESDSVNLDEAVDKYEQAMALLKRMEEYLAVADNKVKKITARFDSD
jgi:exodeoxyribonuclease VII small subunit